MRVMVTGAGGQLGRDLIDVLSGIVPPGGLGIPLPGGAPRGFSCDVVPADHAALDVTRRDMVLAAVEGLRPDVIVHAAAWTAVDACEADPDRAFGVNALGTRNVAEAARLYHSHVVYVSTDYVFDGRAQIPYVEWDAPNPLSVYGRSKLGGERELDSASTIVRTSWVCGARGANMVHTVIRLAGGPGPLSFVDDQIGSPTFTADLAGMVAVLATERLPGVYHVTNSGSTSWYGFARAIMEGLGDDPGRVQPVSTVDLVPPRPAARPANSVLDNAALRLAGLPLLPEWEDGLARLIGAVVAPGN
jgi:dTDP-4-dehydrorhamnose reductase